MNTTEELLVALFAMSKMEGLHVQKKSCVLMSNIMMILLFLRNLSVNLSFWKKVYVAIIRTCVIRRHSTVSGQIAFLEAFVGRLAIVKMFLTVTLMKSGVT